MINKANLPSRAVRIFILTIFVLVGVMVPAPQSKATAATCSGSSCTGLFPTTTGCGSDAVIRQYKDFIIGYVDVRYSATCKAKWARVQNKSGYDRYVAGSLWYGGANYDYNQSISSGGQIANGAQVITPMYGSDAILSTGALGCGNVITFQPTLPVSKNSSTCTLQG